MTTSPKGAGGPPLDANEASFMLHATGHKRNGRNHYCVGGFSNEARVWRGLVSRGLAEEGAPINNGRDAVFRVTPAGYEALYPDESEPAPPTDGPTHVVHHVTCPVHEDQIAELRRAFASLAAHYIMRIGGEYAAEEDAKFAKLVDAGHQSREDCDAECGECSICAWRDCEFRDVMHYHHDGCPSCDVEADVEPPAKEPP